MNKQYVPRAGRSRVTAVAGLVMAAGLISLHAADKTWDGGGDGLNWSASAQNWVGDVAPSAVDALFFDGNIGLTPNNDFAANTVFTNITFNPNAGAFTLSGNVIRLSSGSTTRGGVTNLSLFPQTFNLTIDQNGGSRIFNALSNDIVVTKNINNSTLIKRGPFSLVLSNTINDSSLGASVEEGTLVLAGTINNAIGSTVSVHTNGILRIIGSVTPLNQDQIHFNQRVIMNAGIFQQQHWGGSNTIRLEEIASLSGSNLNSIVENGLIGTTNRLDIGGGSGHRAIYSGTIRDGAAGQLLLQVYRNNNYQQFNGTNTYTGATLVNNTAGTGAARYIMNGAHIGGGAYTVNAGAAADRLAYICGSGIISASVINFNVNAFLAPGGSLSADLNDSATFNESTAILTISNRINLNTSTATLEVQLNGTTAGTGYDQVDLAGSGSISNNNGNLKLVLGYSPSNGDKFTIVKVQGTSSNDNVGTFSTLNGAVTDLSQGATFIEPSSGQNFQISYRAEGSTFDAGVGNGNDIMLRVVSSAGTNLTWRGDVNNAWDVQINPNWRNSLGGSMTFTNGDNVTFDNSGSNNAPVDLFGDLSPGNIKIDTTNNIMFAASTAGKLTGTVVLTKTNTGTLTILTDNDNGGSTILRQGVIQVGTNGTTGTLSGAVNVGTNGSLIFNRSDSSAFAGVISGAGRIAQKGDGILSLTANSTFNGTVSVDAGTLQFGDGSGTSGSIAGMVTNKSAVIYNFNNAVTINNSLTGTGMVSLVNSSGTGRRFSMGAGPTSLTNAGFSGIFNVGPLVNMGTPDGSPGANQLGTGSSVYVADTGSVLLDRSGTYLTTFYIQGAGNGAGNIPGVALELETSVNIVSNVILMADSYIGGFLGDAFITGRILGTNGNETLNFVNKRANATSYNLHIGTTAGPNLWGNTVVDPGDSNIGQQLRVTASAPRSISTNGLTIGAHGIFQLNGFDHTVGFLANTPADGSFVPSVYNGSASTPAVLTVGADSTSTTFDGVFGNGAAAALGVTKVGAGALTLSGNSTNSGAVTVAEGVIALTADGSFSNATSVVVNSGAVLDVTTRNDGSLNLQNGQTLKGNGGVNGNLVTLAGSVVNPGASIGTLTVSNNATLGGTLLMEVNRASSPNSDKLVVVGALTAGGTLAVTNIGTTLQVNDTFQLFPAGVSGFTVALPTTDIVNGVNYTWQNDVASLGSVKVLSVAPVPPPNLGVSQAGNVLTFSWTGAFKLQSQTNSLTTGLGNNWSDYPGGGTSPVNVTINPANPTVFFRLKL